MWLVPRIREYGRVFGSPPIPAVQLGSVCIGGQKILLVNVRYCLYQIYLGAGTFKWRLEARASRWPVLLTIKFNVVEDDSD
jgi:hypothetical protein